MDRTVAPAEPEILRDFTATDCRELVNARVRGYWQSKRVGAAFPSRGALDPLEIPYALRSLILYDVVRQPGSAPPLRFRCRLMGTDIVAKAGFDPTGRFLEDLPMAEWRDYLLQRLAGLVSDPCPVLIRNRQFYDGRWMAYEAIWLPLAEDGVNPDILLACQVYDEMRRGV